MTQKEFNQKVLISQKVLQVFPAAPVAEAWQLHQLRLQQLLGCDLCSGTPSPAARKILDEKNIATTSVKGTGKDGRLLRMML
jgi:2-oxoglutarate dehydrogenase E2 component (dihydrolipoamide succinyltransferase)